MKEAKYIKTIYLKLFRIRQFEKELFFSEDRRVFKNRQSSVTFPQNTTSPALAVLLASKSADS